MFPIATALLMLTAPPMTHQGETAIHVERCRASKVLKAITPLIPQGAHVRADDQKGLLWVTADEKTERNLQSYVNLFDVQPAKLKVHIVIDSPADHVHRTLDTEVDNNDEWSFKDAALDIAIDLTPRINDDATITEKIKTTFGSADQTVIARIKNKTTAYIRPGRYLVPDESKISATDNEAGTRAQLDSDAVPTIHLTLELLPSKAQANSTSP